MNNAITAAAAIAQLAVRVAMRIDVSSRSECNLLATGDV